MTQKEEMLLTKYDLLFESRLTKVEVTLEHLDKNISEFKTDFRWMMGLLITIMLAGYGSLFGLMAHGFKWF